jgi:cytochrome c
MNSYRNWACTALVLGALAGPALANDSIDAGRDVFNRYCRTCHGGTKPPDLAIGPKLEGLVGAKVGTRPAGIHSRAMIDSPIVWDRETLRRFLSVPRRELPAAMMPEGVADPVELESLLDYLESLH